MFSKVVCVCVCVCVCVIVSAKIFVAAVVGKLEAGIV
jgi:hypothetical protein